MSKGKKISQEIIDYVRRNFADKTGYELVAETGLSKSTINRIQARYKLRKSKAHLHDVGVRAGKASNIARGGDSPACYTPEAKAKRVATYKETLRKEEMRVKWGLTQKTKIRLRHGPKSKADQKSYLNKKGYVIDENKLIAYYTEETKRAKRLEKCPRGMRIGNMRAYYSFKPYGELD